MQRRVLRVDRQQQAAAPLLRGERELACGDEALLVRERERHAALERPERRLDTREADDRVQHDVWLGLLEQRRQVAADLDVPDAARLRELRQVRRRRRERAQLELGIAVDDVDRLPPDRAGRAEERYPPHALSVGAGQEYPNASTT